MIVPVHWYQIPLGEVPTFATYGRFITFSEYFHTTLWAGGDGLNPTSQSFRATIDDSLEQVVTQSLESAVRRVQHMFHGTLHGVIFSLGCDSTLPVRDELGDIVGFINGEYTTIELGVAYSQIDVQANFQYMNITSDPQIKLPREISVGPRNYLSRYERPPVI